ncbi:urease accessory protein UreF [Pandoraea oxalativorans]|uniref:Urease accessory protein UreF n=1 Tax=Pandoraea oxalativorans TaxID=573737 RepID=A0A0G3IBK9_9BURK|nr:urease accessory UreF family protein [Pandoraea oxalativorans]AKK24574.1 urease accessory protein UreF [Pandoraea oxalativorans]
MDRVEFPQAPALHLVRLISPSQPVGSFSYSRGLESAVHAGIVNDEPSAGHWILGLLEHSYAPLDGALFWRMIHALNENHESRFRDANAWLAAARESREFELEDRRMSESLVRLLIDLDVPRAGAYANVRLTYPAAFAIACDHWHIAPADALRGLMWSVIEAQVAAATRLVPLAHTSSQRILIASVPLIEQAAHTAMSLADDDIGNVAPALAMMSAWHETQYSRLFRS